MSRRRRFSQALASGLLSTGCNAAYTLLSVPLALAYLSTAEFALWFLTAQIVTYVAISEPCLAGSISRVLIGQKADPKRYEHSARAGFAACILQALAIILIGSLAYPWIASWLAVPIEFTAVFDTLYLCQVFLVGVSAIPRMFSHILIAQQRQDLVNYSQCASFLAMYATQWFAFAHGGGLFSLFWGNLAGALVVSVFPWIAARVLGFLPRRLFASDWVWSDLSEIIRFGGELVLQVIGWQLISGTQLFLIKINVGLEAAGIFAVCTKTGTVLQSIVFRFFDFSVPALSEMVAQRDDSRLRTRFLQLVELTAAVAAVLFVLLACLNQPFVAWWTRGEIHWSSLNDWLFASLLFTYSVTRAQGAFSWIMREPERIRSVFLLEGVAVVVGGMLVTPRFGIPGLFALCIVLNVLFSGAWGASRCAQSGILPRGYLLPRVARPLALLVGFGVIAELWSGLWANYPPFPRFVIVALPLLPIGAVGIWFFGLSPELRHEVKRLVSSFSRSHVAG